MVVILLSPGMRPWAFWLLRLVAAGPLLAQPATFDVRGVALDEALRLARTRAGFSLTYDPALVAGRTSQCVTRETRAAPLLACVLDGTGLVARVLPSGPFALLLAPPVPPPPARLRGRVIDAETGLPLPDASVLLVGSTRGVLASSAGSFALDDLPAGKITLRGSYVGYAQAQASVWLAPDSTSFLTLALRAEPAVITPVIVEGLQFRDPLVAARLSSPPEASEAAPEEVSTRLIGMTGIQPGRVVADLHLQGGEAGEHLMTLDGAPIYAPPVIAGLIGPFSPFAIGRITVQKAGYGALPLSSTVGVIEAEHTFPEDQGRKLDAQVDALALNLRASAGGERADGFRVQMLVASRLSRNPAETLPSVHRLLRDWNRPDPFLAAVTALPSDLRSNNPVESFLVPNPGDDVPRLSFRDLHVAVQALHPSGRRFTASTYVGSRRLVADVPNLGRLAVNTFRDQYTWDSAMGQVRYDALQSPRLRTSVQLRGALYRLNHQTVLPDSLFAQRPALPDDDGNTFSEVSAHAQLAFQASRRVWIEAGMVPALTASRFAVVGVRREPIRHQATRWQLPGYLGARLTLVRHLDADLGLRATTLGGPVLLEPRAALRLDLPHTPLGAFAVRGSVGLYRQFVQPFEVSSISPSSLVSSTRVWLVVDATRPTPVALHYSLEAALLPARGWSVNAETFFRRQFRTLQVDFSADSLSSRNVPQRAFLLVGEGYAYGVSAQTARTLGRTEVRARYEFSFVERQTGLFNDAFYPVPWNDPHRLEVSVAVQPWPRLALSARLTNTWGRTWAFRRAYYDYVGANDSLLVRVPEALQAFVRRQIAEYGLRTPARQHLPPLQRLDVSAAYTQPLGHTRLQLRLDLLNALDTHNVDEYRLIGDRTFYDATRTPGDEGLLRSEPRLALPFTAILALRATW